MTWEDSSVCKYYLVNFCPHELFTNTKVRGPWPPWLDPLILYNGNGLARAADP